MAEGTWVALDVHARKVVAGVLDAESGEVRSLRAPTLPVATVEWLGQFRRPIPIAYEARPTGVRPRACVSGGRDRVHGCRAVEDPAGAGDRVKTDRRDAERLARLLRLGELVAVRVPEPHEEAARDLVRAREDARGELMRARHRLSKLLLRHGIAYDASAWTLAHDAWLRWQRFDSRPLALAFYESYSAVLQAMARRDALDRAIAELAAEPPFAETVGRLCCLRGVATLTALALTVELGDWQRFRPRSLGPFLGLTPSEDSSGERRRARRDHQDRQHARASAAGRGGLAPAPAVARERDARASPPRSARRGTCTGRLQRAPAPPALADARTARQTPDRDRGR